MYEIQGIEKDDFEKMAITLYNGRPTDVSGREDREIRVYDLLDRLGIEYLRADHEPTMTMEACKEVDDAFGAMICKNLFLSNRQQTDFYLLIIPSGKPFKTKELSAQINTSRLSFADESYMEEFLDIHPGAVSVMGLMNDHNRRVRLLVDRDVLESEYIGFHPCVPTSSLKLRSADVFDKFLPAVEHEYTIVTLGKESS